MRRIYGLAFAGGISVAGWLGAACSDDLNSAEYRNLLRQLNAGEYAAAYEWLHPEQKALVLPERFAACYGALSTGSPQSRVVDIESVVVDRETRIPGRDAVTQSVVITATIETTLGEETTRSTRAVHMFGTGPVQSITSPPRWVMDAETFDGAREGRCEGRTPAETIG